MKEVTWEDKDGYLHRSLIRDTDPDNMASIGIPLDPPSLDRLDWDEIKRKLHNALVERGLSTWQNVNEQQTGITSSILFVLKRPIVDLYKQDAAAAKEAKKR